MVKQRFPKREQSKTSQTNPVSPASPQGQLQAQVHTLLKQHKYRQALDAIHKAQRSQPDLTTTPSEAEIWLLRGKHECQLTDFRQATASLRHAIQLGLRGESDYWLAKCLLGINRLDEAISHFRSSFEDGSLPKDYNLYYAKLLLLKGETETVQQLLSSKQAKRFPAAHQHWLRGVLALQAQQPEGALESFQKIKRPLTPGDRPDVWIIYTEQLLGNWEAAALKLGLTSSVSEGWRFGFSPVYTREPILQRLALFQQAKTGKPSIENLKLRSDSQQFQETWNVLAILQLVAENNVHNAVHALLKLDRRSTRFPELSTLRPALLTLAGQQAFNEGELECSEQFWQLFLKEQPFHPQLAVNLIKVLDINESYQELQRLITRLIKWLEQDFKQHPQDWPEHRRKETLAYAHCRLADTWVAMGRTRTGIGELKAAERIYPQSPEVKGRYGLLAVLEKQDQEAIRLLTQALEEGCRSKEVYSVLIDTWKKLGNSEAALEARRRFGKKFGDANPEADVEVLPWVNALSTKNYSFFSGMVQKGGETDPALRACRLFVDAVQGEPTASGKVSLDQRQLVQRWDQLLNGLSAKEQIPTLQAIALSLLLFAKREKGIAALINQYLLKLFELGAQQPTAREAHLVILALKERDAKKLQVPLQSYLATMPQPGNALAEIQLQLRRYAQIIQQNQMLSSYIEEALKREPQNPLLLLAKATTFPDHSAQYEQFQQQGFEIARRLQDAKALKAFRAEQEFLETEEVREFLPDPANLENFSMGDMDRLLEGFIRKMFGKNIPPAELKRMLPELKQMMLDEIMDFGEEEEEEEFGFGFPFGFPFGGLPFDAPPRSRRRRR